MLTDTTCLSVCVIVANLITLSRLPLLLFLLVTLFYVTSWQWHLFFLGLLIILFLMDWFDGYVARLRNEVTDLGAVLDIALDRAVENILWIAFMQLGLVPLWVPVVFLVRSFVVDGIRGAALAKGKSGFGMMHTPWGRFLVASRFMRALYGAIKCITFCVLWLTHALSLKSPGSWTAVSISSKAGPDGEFSQNNSTKEQLWVKWRRFLMWIGPWYAAPRNVCSSSTSCGIRS
ncbi:MAG: CDP-alcohol phosphatidyltransferase family protein [Deltaproteobacteria bacterium]|nr:CDP-alcohol phosphatidyltransferase family protein [Deltaproteobacteria bacterium]